MKITNWLYLGHYDIDWNRKLTVAEKYWLAALIDGEGTLCFVRQKEKHCKRGFRLRMILEIGNCNKEIIERTKEIIGFGRTSCNRRSQRNSNEQDLHIYGLDANGLRWLLPQLKDILIVTREQCKLMLEGLGLIEQHYSSFDSQCRSFGFTPHDERLNEIRKQISRLNRGKKNK